MIQYQWSQWVKCPKCYDRMWLFANWHRCGWKRKGKKLEYK